MGAGLEDLYLAVGEFAPRAFGHVLELQAGKVTAVQADHRMVDLAQHALDLVFAALTDDDLHGGGAGLDALRSHGLSLMRVNDAADRRLAQAVVELDAATEWFQVAIGQVAVHERLVGLVDVLAGVQQILRQVAVGGKEQKARGVAVQAVERLHVGRGKAVTHRQQQVAGVVGKRALAGAVAVDDHAGGLVDGHEPGVAVEDLRFFVHV